jgi:hypothetical protein
MVSPARRRPRGTYSTRATSFHGRKIDSRSVVVCSVSSCHSRSCMVIRSQPRSGAVSAPRGPIFAKVGNTALNVPVVWPPWTPAGPSQRSRSATRLRSGAGVAPLRPPGLFASGLLPSELFRSRRRRAASEVALASLPTTAETTFVVAEPAARPTIRTRSARWACVQAATVSGSAASYELIVSACQSRPLFAPHGRGSPRYIAVI